MNENETTNILILDDHTIIIDGIKSIVRHMSQFKIIDPPALDDTIVDFVAKAKIQIVLLDLQQRTYDAYGLCKALKRKYSDLRILGINIHGNRPHIAKILRLGLDGYLVKTAGATELISAIEYLHKGKKYFSPTMRKNIMMDLNGQSISNIERLSKRETQILQLIVDELTTEEIADQLFISRTTVVTHRKNLLRKLQAKNAAGLVKAAYEYRLLT